MKISLNSIQRGDTPAMIIGLVVSPGETFLSIHGLFILTIKTFFRSLVGETTRVQTQISFTEQNDPLSGKRNDRIPLFRFKMLKHSPMLHGELRDK